MISPRVTCVELISVVSTQKMRASRDLNRKVKVKNKKYINFISEQLVWVE